MKFSARTEMAEAPEPLFAALADFAGWEAKARRHGIEVERIKGGVMPAVGALWAVHFVYRGRGRHTRAELTNFDAPRTLAFSGQSGGFTYSVDARLVPLARQTTRLLLDFEIQPRTLAARILLQTARLGRARLNARFQHRTDALGRLILAHAQEMRAK